MESKKNIVGATPEKVPGWYVKPILEECGFIIADFLREEGMYREKLRRQIAKAHVPESLEVALRRFVGSENFDIAFARIWLTNLLQTDRLPEIANRDLSAQLSSETIPMWVNEHQLNHVFKIAKQKLLSGEEFLEWRKRNDVSRERFARLAGFVSDSPIQKIETLDRLPLRFVDFVDDFPFYEP